MNKMVKRIEPRRGGRGVRASASGSAGKGQTGSGTIKKGLVVGLMLLMAMGCSGLFDVDNPASLLDGDLDTPGLIETLANSPEGNMAGTYGTVTIQNSLVGGELFHPSTQLENIDAMRGSRLASNSSVEGAWRGLAQVRWLSDEVVDRISRLVPNPTANMGVARAYFFGGVSRMTMADHYNVIVYGPEDELRSPITVITDAIERFQQAAQVSGAAGNANYQAASLGQIARAYRSLYFEELHLRGNVRPSLFAQAEGFARQAIQLNPDFDVSLRYGAPGGSNAMSALGGPFGGINRIDETFLFVADPVTGAWDPRLPHEETIRPAPLGQTSFNLKYPRRESPLPLSRAAEARLIIAEARLMAGDLQGAVEWINANRAAARLRVSGSNWSDAGRGWPPARELSDLRAFASSDAAEVQAQLRHERLAEFWMEQRRWQDMRYYETVPYRWFPTNIEMGLQLRWPPDPQEVDANPNLTPEIANRVYVN